ncbi:MAG: adenylate kinase [Candidatus Margulisiibacteriota bacterium]
MILVFIGPPGSGKGTQAKMLAEKLSLPHISVGDLLRDEIRKGSDLGIKAKSFMDGGNLVPDELTIQLTKERIARPDCGKGFIMDGFPRSDIQAKAFDKMLAESGLEMDKVVYFKVSQEEVVKRLSGRRSCKDCGAVFHIDNKPSKKGAKCDICGGDLIQRPDDSPSVIANRFVVYEKQTKPLIEHYEKMNKILELDASKPIDEIFSHLDRLGSNAQAL